MFDGIFQTFTPKSKIPVIDVAIDRTNQLLCVAQHLSNNQPTLTLFETTGKKSALKTVEMSNLVFYVVWEDEENIVYATNSADGFFALKQYNIKANTPEVLYEFENKHYQLRLSRHGQNVLLLEEKDLVIFNIEQKTKTHVIPIAEISDQNTALLKFALFDDNALLYHVEGKGEVYRHDLTRREVLKTFSGDFANIDFIGTCKNICYAVGAFGKGIFVWDKLKGDMVKGDFLNDPDFVVLSAAVSSNEHFIALGNHVGFIAVVDLRSGEFIFSKRIHKKRVTALKFDAAGDFLISGGEDAQVYFFHFNQ